MLAVFADLPDPRAPNARYRLCDLMFIALAAALCGAQSCAEYALFARSKTALLSRFMDLPAAPSHDTFSRVFRLLDPKAFEAAFAAFMAGFAAAAAKGLGVVAIDGKALRRAYEAGGAAAPPLLVTAWASQARLALAGASAPAGTSEVDAALAVIALLDLDGRIVTADALHCRADTAAAILDRGGDYALVLKANHPKLLKDAKARLAAEADAPSTVVEETSHGRREVRSARVVAAPGMAEAHGFPGLAAVAAVTSRRDGGAEHVRLVLLSRPLSPGEALAVVRAHWDVENGLHFCLDVALGEDLVRSRKDGAPANIAVLNRLAMNLLRSIDDPKTSLKGRIKRAAWEEPYLLNAIAHMR